MASEYPCERPGVAGSDGPGEGKAPHPRDFPVLAQSSPGGVSNSGPLPTACNWPPPATASLPASSSSSQSAQIGRASCREKVWQYVEISGVAGSLKKKIQTVK